MVVLVKEKSCTKQFLDISLFQHSKHKTNHNLLESLSALIASPSHFHRKSLFPVSWSNLPIQFSVPQYSHLLQPEQTRPTSSQALWRITQPDTGVQDSHFLICRKALTPLTSSRWGQIQGDINWQGFRENMCPTFLLPSLLPVHTDANRFPPWNVQ